MLSSVAIKLFKLSKSWQTVLLHLPITYCVVQLLVLLQYNVQSLSAVWVMCVEAFRAPQFSSGPDKDGFNLGTYRNFKEVFGENKKLWLLPVYSR